MGNRETFNSPGFQWISVGSGIEHAEGGGTPAGQNTHGFQIWLRMPLSKMENDPRYGTVHPHEIPTVNMPGYECRVIAGSLDGTEGPAKFSVNVQILDMKLDAGAECTYQLPEGMDNVMFYPYKGDGTLNGSGEQIKSQQICRFNTETGCKTALFKAGSNGCSLMIFAGKMTRERIIWHGPFVCSSNDNLRQCFTQYQMGRFPPKRVDWDYKNVRAHPGGR